DTGAQTEDGAAVRDLVERGDGHGGQRGMARVGIGDAGPEADAGRARGYQAEDRVGLAEEALVGQPEIVVAERLGTDGEIHDLADGTRRKQQEPGPHGARSSR